MLTPCRGPVGQDDREGGFTLLEIMVVTLVMGVVLAIAGSALLSLQKATLRNGAMVTDEQDASTTLAQMARDIRSAHSIQFFSSTTNAADTVILNLNQTSGTGTTPVEWVYQPPTAPAVVGNLSRVVLSSALTPVATRVMLTDVANGSTPVFSYYDVIGDAMATSGSAANQTLTNCTTAINVNLLISPSPVPGVSNFTESDEVAITDQQQILSAPGNGQCGTAP